MKSELIWEMNIYTFPSWLIIDKTTLNEVITVTINDAELKIYPPYRSSPANEIFSPQPDKSIFPDGELKPINRNYKIPKTALYPLFNNDGVGIKSYQLEDKVSWNSNRKNRNDMPVDSIRIDVKSKSEFNLLKYMKYLLEIARINSNQWWIGHLPYTLDNITVTQKVNEKGLVLAENPPTVWSPPCFVSFCNEKVIGLDIWRKAIEDSSLNKVPKIYKTSLLDSIYYTSRNDSRRAILDLANALDTAVDINFLRIWKIRSSNNYSRKSFMNGIPVKEGLRYNSRTHIPLLISHVTNHVLSGRSFETEYPSEFMVITEFWDEIRNPTSHGKSINVDAVELIKYVKSIQKCVDWLEKI